MAFNYNFNPNIKTIFDTYSPAASNFSMQSKFQLPKYQATQMPESPLGIELPKSQYIDAYAQHLNNLPSRGNPNIWAKLAAGLAGASTGYFKGPGEGMQTMRSYLDAPYERNLQDWGIKAEGLKQAADLESKGLANENTTLRNILNYDAARGRTAATENRTASQERLGQGQLAIEQQKVDLATTKLNQGNYNYVGMTQTGNPIVINKTDGKHQILDDVDMFSDQEKLSQQLDAAMARASLASSTSMRNTDVRVASQEKMNQEDIDAAYTRAILPEANNQNASLINLENQNKLMQLSTKYPKLIYQTTQGKYFVVTPQEPSFWREDLRPQFQQLLNEINPKPTTSRTTLPRVNSPTSSSTSSVEMVDQQGNSYMIPASQVSAAEADGLRRK